MTQAAAGLAFEPKEDGGINREADTYSLVPLLIISRMTGARVPDSHNER